MAKFNSCIASVKLPSDAARGSITRPYRDLVRRLEKSGISKTDAEAQATDLMRTQILPDSIAELTAKRDGLITEIRGRSAAPTTEPPAAPAVEIAPETTTAEETPKRPFALAAPQAAARAAPSASPSSEPTGQSAVDRQITKAAASADPAAQLRTLKNELITRRDVAADAGRSTTEITQAIDRIDGILAEGVTPVAGVLTPDSPQSVWASAMDDDGVGYTNMSEDGRRAWDSEVKTSPTRPTKERAQYYQDTFLSEDTQKGISYVRSLASKLGTATDERFLQITEKLGDLANSGNPRVAAEAQKALDSAYSDTPGQFSLAGWNTRQGTTNANGTPTTPMATGRVRMVVQNFISRLATKPNVTVVANQRELQRNNPALFARASAARPQGDFATADAAGYSFGDGQVIIFTDRIVNEQHLRFVLAHETFGHFGMRGVVPQGRFDTLMRKVYETDPSAKLAVDAAMEMRGLPLSEAVEEYLSDYAALLDASIVARVWNVIKGFLDRLGIKSGDTITRYLLDHSRRYVREGAQGVPFNMEQTLRRIHAVEYGEAGTGRFSPQAALSDNAKANFMMSRLGAWPKSLTEALDTIARAGKNFANGYDEFKAKFLSLANFRALENAGLSQFDDLMSKMNEIAMSVKSSLNEYFRPVIDADAQTRERLSKTLYDARSYKISQFKKEDAKGDPLFSVGKDGAFVANEAEQERIFKAGLMSLKQIRGGYSYEFPVLGTDGKITATKKQVAGQSEFSDDDYDLYVRTRRAVFNVEMQLLQAEYASFLANKSLTTKEVSNLMRDGNLTAADRRFIDTMARKALELYTNNVSTDASGNTIISAKSMEDSSRFLEAVNAAVIGKDTDRNAKVREFFGENTKAADAFIENITDFKSRRKDRASISEADLYVLQNKVKQLFLDQHNLTGRDTAIRRSIMTGYTPVMREGTWQTRVQAYVNGKPVEVKDAHQDLLAYSQFETETDALDMVKMLDEEFKGKTYDLLVRNENGEFVPTKVTLGTRAERVLDAVAADPQLNLQDFLYGLNIFNVNLNPASMERIVTTLTRQADRARMRLNFSQTPGFDPTTGILAVSRHIESRASTIAKAATRQPLRELMNLNLEGSRQLWEGDKPRVDALAAEVARLKADPNASADAVRYAERELSHAQYQYRMTNPEGRAGRSMIYYNQAAATMDYLEANKFVDESNFGSGPVASRVRAYTATWQLGGSLAQGALNLISPYTNWMPYMASYNAKSGFGGGFGIGRVQAEYHRAFTKIGAPGIGNLALNRADFYDSGAKPTDAALSKTWKPGIAQDPALQKKYGLSAEEARVIAREIREGKLIPAQSNALIATARGQTTNKYVRNIVDGFMAPFNLTEQATRRAAFLAAYRLERDRALAGGRSEKQAAEQAREFAVKSLDLTLGDYSVLNRPPAWRGGITSFIYMYKTYPTTVIQLLANLSRPAQVSMLASLWFLSGAAGLPFAEDLEDLIDTIAQRLGFRQGSIRAEIVRHLEATFPGMSALFLKGVVNQWLPIPADIASRTSMGNVIPGTGMFLAGANTTRELFDIAGPAAGFIAGSAKSATDLLTVPFSATKSLEDVARESPITVLRLMGDAYAYAQSGAVVDRRGYVVSQEMGMGTLAVRLAGFYPTQAASQYDVIRIAQRQIDYQKEAVAGFRQAWIKATLRGDTQTAADVAASVNAWNNATRGTPLEIRNFMGGNMRALREAQRPAGERALKAAPRAAQEDIRGLVDALTE